MEPKTLLPGVGEGIPERILVAGGAGFIGSTFVRKLLLQGQGFAVTVLDKLTYAGNLGNLEEVSQHPRYRFVQGDICDRELALRLARDVDCIVNFAAETHVDRSILEPDAFIQTDVVGTHSLLEAARLAQHRRFLQVSTDEVYGDVPSPRRSVETDPLRPRSPYSASKASAELLCLAYHATYGMDVLLTRGSNTYGPHQYPEKIVPLFITQALDGLPLPVYGDGGAVRDYLFVEDHGLGIATVLARGLAGNAYNLGRGDAPVSGLEVAETVLQLTGADTALAQRVEDRPGHDRRYALDSAKAHGLGWSPKVGFAEGMRQTVDWYRDHRGWWGPVKEGEFADFYRRNYRPLAGPVSS
ncbi:MAG: dTDP-glucose 4,6-dehydratase [Candidatus Dormibacteria bacterium]